jgi:hypothetical protein
VTILVNNHAGIQIAVPFGNLQIIITQVDGNIRATVNGGANGVAEGAIDMDGGDSDSTRTPHRAGLGVYPVGNDDGDCTRILRVQNFNGESAVATVYNGNFTTSVGLVTTSQASKGSTPVPSVAIAIVPVMPSAVMSGPKLALLP